MKSAQMKNAVFVVIISVVLSYSVATGLKLLIAEPRPCILLDSCPDSFSFPSRHTTVAFAVSMSLFALFKTRWSALLFLVAGLVGYWRLAAGVHTLNDVIGGSIIGAAVGLLSYTAVLRLIKHRSRRLSSSHRPAS